MLYILGMKKCGQDQIVDIVHQQDENEKICAEQKISMAYKVLATNDKELRFIVIEREVYAWLDDINSQQREADKLRFERYYRETRNFFSTMPNSVLFVHAADEDLARRILIFACSNPIVEPIPNLIIDKGLIFSGWMKMGIRFVKARAKWIAAKKPLRTLEAIATIYDEYCVSCFAFDNDSCGVCGCRLKRETQTMNKLAWATEVCPLNPPRWKADVEMEEQDITEADLKDIKKPPTSRRKHCCGG